MELKMKLKYEEKIELSRAQECKELRKRTLELANLLPGKVEDIDELRR